MLESGHPVTVTYDARTDEDLIFGLGLGCEGSVELLIERVPERPDGGHLALVARCLREREKLALATVFRSSTAVPVGARFWLVEGDIGCADFADDGLAQELGRAADAVLARDRHQALTIEAAGGAVTATIEPIVPFPELVIFGAGPDARPVARLAVELGFEVTVADHRPAFARAELFPGARRVLVCQPAQLADLVDPEPTSAVLVMSHAFAHDRGWLGGLLGRRLRYLGVLGPRRRTERLLAELAAEGVVASDEDRARLHAPVGLDIGAETSEEVAVSILAEICAELTGRGGGSLRERDAPIHGDGA